jgi:hypothetical protein
MIRENPDLVQRMVTSGLRRYGGFLNVQSTDSKI